MKKNIEKAQSAISNSYVTTIKNCLSVHPQTLRGQQINAKLMFTSDEQGETLTVYDPSTKKQVVIPYGQVEELILHTRNAKNSEVTK